MTSRGAGRGLRVALPGRGGLGHRPRSARQVPFTLIVRRTGRVKPLSTGFRRRTPGRTPCTRSPSSRRVRPWLRLCRRPRVPGETWTRSPRRGAGRAGARPWTGPPHHVAAVVPFRPVLEQRHERADDGRVAAPPYLAWFREDVVKPSRSFRARAASIRSLVAPCVGGIGTSTEWECQVCVEAASPSSAAA